MRAIAFAFLLLIPSQAHALDYGAVAWYGGAATLDIWSTEKGKAAGAREGNPLLRSTPALVIGHAMTGAVLVWADSKIPTKKGKWIMRGVVGALAVGVTINNLNQGANGAKGR